MIVENYFSFMDYELKVEICIHYFWSQNFDLYQIFIHSYTNQNYPLSEFSLYMHISYKTYIDLAQRHMSLASIHRIIEIISSGV